MSGQAEEGLRECLERLARLSEDESGVISIETIDKSLRTVGLTFTRDDLLHQIADTDTDGDGRWEVNEFDAFFAKQRSLVDAGIDGALEPWDLGRCLPMDALPLAARTFTAHNAVEEAIGASAPSRRADASKARRGPLASAPEPAAPEPPTSRRAVSSAKPAAAAPPSRSRCFHLWEATKSDFAEYKAMRTAYEETWKSARRPLRGVPRRLASSASAPSIALLNARRLAEPRRWEPAPRVFVGRGRAPVPDLGRAPANPLLGGAPRPRAGIYAAPAWNDALDDGRPRSGLVVMPPRTPGGASSSGGGGAAAAAAAAFAHGSSSFGRLESAGGGDGRRPATLGLSRRPTRVFTHAAAEALKAPADLEQLLRGCEDVVEEPPSLLAALG